MTITAADLFCGTGGTTAGAHQAGIQVLWAANHWAPACEWHERNHPDVTVIQQDLAEMDWASAIETDILLASPACQGHSEAGQPAAKGRGGSHAPDPGKLKLKHQRDRNTAWAVLAAADTLMPRAIAIENTLRFQDWAPEGGPKDGRTFRSWCSVLESFGYQVRVHTINAREYGSAQDRPRTIITASLGDPIDLVPSLGLPDRTIADCLDPAEATEKWWRPIADLPERMRVRIAKAQREAGSLCFWNNVSEARGRPLDGPFPTATTQSGTQWNIVDGARCRVMNPREIARSMNFPESYEIPTQRKLAGKLLDNAMDVSMAAGIGRQLMEAV